MPIDRLRPQSLHIPSDESGPQRPRSNTAHLEYERLMVEAKQAFDRLTTQNPMARSTVAARRNSTTNT
jgi:hypothetical protein